MSWYGENKSKRETRFNIGDIVRYDYGSSALMRIESVREMGKDPRGISCSVRYYGRQTYGEVQGIYHGQIHGLADAAEVKNFKAERNRYDIKRNLYAGLTFDDWLEAGSPPCRTTHGD